uniref:Cna B-type domain-containing protein n=1 Tax=Coprococcus sp. TaxID=2049024 RepID=UPI003FEE8FEC
MFKMKRQWKRIISTIMAALMVVTVIPSSFGSSSAAEIATPGDADQTGYVKIEAKLPESDKKGEDVTGIVYEVYKDASCKDEVGAFVLSCDGKAYSNDNEPVVYADQEKINEKKLAYLELPEGTYYYQMAEKLYKSEKEPSDQNVAYDDQIYTFSLTAKATKKKAVVLKPELTTVQQTATPTDAAPKTTSDDFTVIAGTTETEIATPADGEPSRQSIIEPVAFARMMMVPILRAASSSYYARRTTSSYMSPKMYLQDQNYTDLYSIYCGDHDKAAANYHEPGTKGDPVTLHTYGVSSGSPLSSLGNDNVVKSLYYGYKNSKAWNEIRRNLDYYRHGTANGNPSAAFDVTNEYNPTNKYNAEIKIGTVSLANKTVNNVSAGTVTKKNIAPSGEKRYLYSYEVSKNLSAKGSNANIYKLDESFYKGTGHKLTGLTASESYKRSNIYKVESLANSYTITVPKNVICYTTTGKAEKGINTCTWTKHAAGAGVTLSGGTYFMFVAKIGYSGISSIDANASKDGFVAYFIEPSSSVFQNFYAGELYNYSVSFDINWEMDEGSAKLELSKIAADGSTSWNYNVYNMAGIRYEIYDAAGNKATSSSHTRGDGITVAATTQIVLSYNGKAYMDEDGKNIIFVSPSAKAAYKKSHDLYTFRWYRDDILTDTKFSYKEAATTTGNTTGKASYYYDDGTATTKALIAKLAGKNISVTGFEQDTVSHDFTFSNSSTVSNVVIKTSDKRSPFWGSFKLTKVSASTAAQDTDYYNMAGIKYGIYADDKNGSSTVTASSHTRSDGITVAPSNRVVLSYDGAAYMDTNGKNVVFVNAKAKASYKNTYGSPYYYRWYKHGLYEDTTYYYKESAHLLDSTDNTVAYYYNDASGSFTEAINKISGQNVEVTGFLQDTEYHDFTIPVGSSVEKNIEETTSDDIDTAKAMATKSYAGNSSELKGVEFNLYKVSGNNDTYVDANLVGTFVHNGTSLEPDADSIKSKYKKLGVAVGTGSNAAYFTNLPYGWYCLVEDAATAQERGFSVAAPVYLEATSSNKTLNFKMSDIRSGLKLQKQFDKTPMNKLCNYSLDGAEYKAYITSGNGVESTSDYICTFTTDADGNGYVSDYNKNKYYALADVQNGRAYKLVGLPIGSWVYIKETKSSAGCDLDSNAYYLHFTADNMEQTVTSTEPLKNDPLEIYLEKKDSTSGDATGSASLAGAEFTVKYYDVPVTGANAVTKYEQLKGKTPTRTWVYRTDENGAIRTTQADKYLVKEKSSDLYFEYGVSVIPLGAITIEETKAPAGYTLAGRFFKNIDTGECISNDDGVIFVAIKDAHSLSSYLGDNAIIKEEVSLRGDIKFKKVALDTDKPLSGIAFRITSKTTGESHVVVTDADGMIDTSKIKHSENTNAADKDNKTISGTWFYGNDDGEKKIDDSLGALPFDTYEITEIATDTNTEYRLITPITVDLTKEADYTDGYQLYDLGTVTNIPEPYIGTRALGVKTQDNIIPANEKVDVEDISDYHFLEAGKTYTMKGVIKDPETGKAYKQPDGTYSLGHKVFTTDSDDTGYVSAEVRTPLVLDTTGLDGKNVVVAEYLFEGSDDTDLTINEDGTVDETGVVKTHTGRLVKHDDLTSKSQTLSVPKITKISVKKVWNDADNADGIRPESIKVQLYKNGNTKVYDAVELSEKNNWSYTWEGLPTMENNEDIIYAVDEVEIPAGYEKEVTNKETKFIITNTHVPDVTKISVEKVWDDNNDQDGIRPAAIKVQLYADGKASGRTVELSENNGWKYTWKDLDKQKDGEDIVYTVDEVEVPDGYIKTVTSKGTAFTITNTHTPETTAVKVTKVWKDSNDKYQKRPGSIRVQLYKTVAGELEAVGEPVTLDKSMNWTYTWTDLALQENGITIIYTVDEISVPEGYTKTVTKDADSNITAFIITNSKPDTPKTGDSFRLIPVAVLMAAAFVTGVFVWRKKRKK